MGKRIEIRNEVGKLVLGFVYYVEEMGFCVLKEVYVLKNCKQSQKGNFGECVEDGFWWGERGSLDVFGERL